MGNDESHFNVSLIVRDKSHKTVSTNHNLFEEKGEPKRNQAEALLLTSVTPYRWAKPAHNATPPVVVIHVPLSDRPAATENFVRNDSTRHLLGSHVLSYVTSFGFAAVVGNDDMEV